MTPAALNLFLSTVINLVATFVPAIGVRDAFRTEGHQSAASSKVGLLMAQDVGDVNLQNVLTGGSTRLVFAESGVVIGRLRKWRSTSLFFPWIEMLRL